MYLLWKSSFYQTCSAQDIKDKLLWSCTTIQLYCAPECRLSVNFCTYPSDIFTLLVFAPPTIGLECHLWSKCYRWIFPWAYFYYYYFYMRPKGTQVRNFDWILTNGQPKNAQPKNVQHQNVEHIYCRLGQRQYTFLQYTFFNPTGAQIYSVKMIWTNKSTENKIFYVVWVTF